MDPALSEFLQEYPFILNGCLFFGGLFLIGLIGLVYFNSGGRGGGKNKRLDANERRRRIAELDTLDLDTALPSKAPSTAFVPAASADMPDMDLLLGSVEPPAPAAAPRPAAPQPVPVAAPPKPVPAAAPPAPRPTPTQAPSAVQMHSLTMNDGSIIDAAEVMTLLRDVSEGQLVFRIGGRAFTHGREIDDPELRRRFLNTARDLMAMGQQASQAPAPTGNSSAPRAQVTAVVLSDGRTVNAAEMLTVARDIGDGQLVLSLSGRGFTDATSIDDAELRKRFLAVLRDLYPMAQETANAPMPEKVVAPPRPPAPAPLPPVAGVPRPVIPVEPLEDGRLPGDLPKFDQTSDELKFSFKLRNTSKTEPVPELNIASAIETFLQYKRDQTGAFAGRRIHVLPAMGGGVRIEVDGQYFEAVSDITDTEVRQFIANAIEEWQSRQ